MKIEFETRKMAMSNLMILAKAVNCEDACINVHYRKHKPNLYSVGDGMRWKAGELAEFLKMILECEHGEVEYSYKHSS